MVTTQLLQLQYLSQELLQQQLLLLLRILYIDHRHKYRYYICNNSANYANSRIVSERKSSSKKGAVVQFHLYHLAPKT